MCLTGRAAIVFNILQLPHLYAVIPHEIKKRSPKAEEAYRRALRNGKMKIPRCSLQVFGEQRVGKTSVLRSLAGKTFIEDLDSTRGIDNGLVDTPLDINPISTCTWKEVKPENQAQENDTLFVEGVVREYHRELLMPPYQQKQEGISHVKLPKHDPEKHHDSSPLKSLQVIQPVLSPTSKPQTIPPSLSTSKHEETHTHTSQKVLSERAPRPTPIQPSHTLPRQQIAPAKQVFRLSGRHHSLISQMMKAAPQPLKEPMLRLNTYDFAGQKQYHHMHHCFISRRALYLVVFNLQHMIEYLSNDKIVAKTNHLEEIRYWLNFIHIHIHISAEEDKRTKRVFLVGTHKAPKHGKMLRESDLQKIDKELWKMFFSNAQYANHIYCGQRTFLAIENSLDGEGERGASGVNDLRNELIKVSKDLHFLEEQYPIVWLRFERALLQVREECRQSKTPPLIKLEEAQRLRQACGIEPPDADHALHFFHDTGTIVCLSKLFIHPRTSREVRLYRFCNISPRAHK